MFDLSAAETAVVTGGTIAGLRMCQLSPVDYVKYSLLLGSQSYFVVYVQNYRGK